MSFTLPLLIFIGVSFSANAQQDATILNKIVSITQRFDSEYTPEKIYIHFDKPFYAVGDTIWFKGYVTDGQNHPSKLSKVLYIEVLNEADSLVHLLKVPIENGFATGNLFIDKKDFKHGNYYVRSYTLWMTNFDPDFFFYKSIAIGESIDRQVRTNIHFINTGDQKVDVRIIFRDPDGKPYSNKQVNWQIITNYDVVAKGRSTTDANGIIHVIIADDQKKVPLEKNSQLVTQLLPNDKDDAIATSFNLQHIRITNDIQFFPEGGDFIQGVPVQVGFKSINSYGLGTGSKGRIQDEDGNTVAEFSSKHAGMGSFYLNMEPKQKYFAHITFSDGTSIVKPLPMSKVSGVTIQATFKSLEFIDVRVVASAPYLSEHKSQKLYLVAQNNGVIYFAAQGVLDTQTFSARLARSKMPEGIIQLVLFSDKGDPLSERMIFVSHNKNSLNFTMKADKASYGIKQRVVLTMNATDSTNVAVGMANLSLSVVDETKVPINEDAETTILSALLLTSDLKGYVEQPNYYFNKPNAKKASELDYLMLTQGYRRFSYNEILANKFPEKHLFPEQGISISGTLRDKTGLPKNKGTLLLTIPQKRFNKQLLTNPVGEFAFNDLIFDDGNSVTISAKYNPNPNNTMIIINGMPEAALGRNKNAADEVPNIDSAMSKYLDNSAKQYQFLRTIKEVKIVTKAVKRTHADHPALSTLPMLADHTLLAEQFPGCNKLTDCLRSSLTGVTYYEDNFYVSRGFNNGERIPMSIYLNGLPTDYRGIDVISPKELESVEIFLTDPMGTIDRNNNTRGVIVLNVTKPPKSTKISAADLKKLIPDAFIVSYKPKGYIVQKEFYTPKYSVNPADLNFTDLRTTVYWNPTLTTDAQGNASVEFFNADGRGTYRAVLEGTDAKGNVGRTVFRYTVK